MKEREYLTPVTENFLHSIGVGIESFKLAIEFGLNPVTAFIAGSLHDLGGAIPVQDRIKVAEECGIKLCEEELQYPLLIHAKQGAYLAKNFIGIDNKEIIDSILYHTTCIGGASDFIKIIFLADKIHWDRNGLPPYLYDLREAIKISLNMGCRTFLEWLWNDDEKLVVHPMLKNSYNFYCKNLYSSFEQSIEFSGKFDLDIIQKYYLDKISLEYVKIFTPLLSIVDSFCKDEITEDNFYHQFLSSIISNSSNTISESNFFKIKEYFNINDTIDNFRKGLNIYFAKTEFNIFDTKVLKLIDDNSNNGDENLELGTVISELIDISYRKWNI